MDMEGLAKDLKKLRDENRDLILSPQEKDQLGEMERLKKLKLGPARKALLGMIAGGLIGHQAGMPHDVALGTAGGGAILQHYLDPAIRSMLETRPFQLADKALADRRLPLGGLGAAIGNTLGNSGE